VRTHAFTSDRLLAHYCALQLGLVATHQVEAAGFDPRILYRRSKSGLLRPVFRNVFASTDLAGDPRQLHLAGGLAVRESIISGMSAAVLHGFPIPPSRALNRTATLTVHPDRQCELDGIQLHRSRYPLPSKLLFGVPTLTRAATVISLAAALSEPDLERALDHGLLQKWFSVRTIHRLLRDRPNCATKGREKLEALIVTRADGSAHRSKTEQRTGRWLTRGGLVNWRRNLLIRIDGEDQPIEVDFGWAVERVVLEVSPFATHATKLKQERDAVRRRLLTRMGFRIVEATDQHLMSEARFRPIAADLRALGAT
jgi:hypothetical protein